MINTRRNKLYIKLNYATERCTVLTKLRIDDTIYAKISLKSDVDEDLPGLRLPDTIKFDTYL